MTLVMDAHTLEGGVAAADVAAAHQADLETQAYTSWTLSVRWDAATGTR
jgi:hypothetical protein